VNAPGDSISPDAFALQYADIQDFTVTQANPGDVFPTARVQIYQNVGSPADPNWGVRSVDPEFFPDAASVPAAPWRAS
jgi:hypothetical protein